MKLFFIFLFAISSISLLPAMEENSEEGLTFSQAREKRIQKEKQAQADQTAEPLKQVEVVKQKTSDYKNTIENLKQALSFYELEQTKKCLETLTAIDPYDKLQLWKQSRPMIEIYAASAMNGAERAHKVEIADQIAAAINLFDQAHTKLITQA